MNITKEYLEKSYIVDGKNTTEISQKCRVKPKRILYLMSKFGIARRPKTETVSHHLQGKTFGFLTVLERDYQQNVHPTFDGSYWKCKCSCGNETIVRGTSLVGGLTKSCGCLWKSASYKEISGVYLWSIRNSAKNRNFSFEVTPEYLWNLYLDQNKKCVLSGVELKFGDGLNMKNQTASLDRIDSSKGYIVGNVQWVHKEVNRLKTDMPQDEFLEWVQTIAKHQTQKSNL